MKYSAFRKTLLALVGCGALLAPSLSQAWWNSDWGVRKKISVDTAKTGADLTEAVANVPLLLRLHSGNFSFLDAKEDGSDIRFVAEDDKTPLKFHFEKYDPLNELALVWVQVPALSGASTTNALWIYSGNNKATAAADAKGTYDVNQVAVYHFDEKNAAIVDQTAYANHANASAVTRDTASIIGAGLSLSGGEKIVVPATPSLSFSADNGITLSMWIKVAATTGQAVLFDMRNGATGLSVGLDQGQPYAKINGAGAAVDTPRHGSVVPNTWQHLAVSAGKRLIVYLNGVEISSAIVALPALNGAITIGAAASGSNSFIGALDEVTLSNSVRNAAWIKSAARSPSPDFKMTTFGTEERTESGGTSYFSTILHSVTLDGWVVIFILIIMAGISWVVMIDKAIVIVRATEDNIKFSNSYRRLASDPGVLDRGETGEDDIEKSPKESAFSTALFGAHDHFQCSPIYQIYHVGIQEIKQRFGHTDPKEVGKVLSPQSLGAIRASLDAVLVREQQKLNSQMVLLTIAISGGPFLGLLGTVVGVMITFAAIAASGDVNVNAIAPGIAAALVATVAGLAVAIPALFGYNYLISRIKSMSADMHVFVDEFVHKVAENYGV